MGQEASKSQRTIYTLIIPKSVQKDLRKLLPQLQEELLFHHLPSIQANPHRGLFLKGKFRAIRKHNVSFKGAEYRITYRIVEEAKTIILIMIGSRESYYSRLGQRLRH
jgi:mRNA-degrading endonuclease RelE of RelBE toxin-antitoxin system